MNNTKIVQSEVGVGYYELQTASGRCLGCFDSLHRALMAQNRHQSDCEAFQRGYVFQVAGTDYASARGAIEAVEAMGQGSVIKFHVEQNLPNCLPAYVYRSASMWRYQDGAWHAWSIHGPTSQALEIEQPH
jgi:hypothetical protein